MQRVISSRRLERGEREARKGREVRGGLVARAKRRLAEGYYDNPALLDLAVARMLAAFNGSRPARAAGRKDESARARRSGPAGRDTGFSRR